MNHNMKHILGAFAGAFLLGCADPSGPSRVPAPNASVSGMSSHRYIVQGAAVPVGVKARHRYTKALKGFAAELSDQQVTALRASGAVVTADGVTHLHDIANNQAQDRIDQRGPAWPAFGGLDGVYVPTNHGAGVTAYVIDTGIDYSHPDFGGRAVPGWDFEGGNGADCFGHGTQVAGIIGGTLYGIANAVTIVSVRAFPCGPQGFDSDLIAAMEWVAVNAHHPAVVNMSFGDPGSPNDLVGLATQAMIATGVVGVASAGNDDGDACLYRPASVPSAITVTASDPYYDVLPGWANGGPCVDIIAPGMDITAPKNGGGTVQFYGTSAASPVVAGAAAQVLAADPGASVATVTAKILGTSTQGAIGLLVSPYTPTRPPGTPNLLVYSRELGGTQPPPPSASFTVGCSGFTCTFTGQNSGSWTFGDGGSTNGLVVSHTFQKRQQSYLVTHTVGALSATASVHCWPKKCS